MNYAGNSSNCVIYYKIIRLSKSYLKIFENTYFIGSEVGGNKTSLKRELTISVYGLREKRIVFREMNRINRHIHGLRPKSFKNWGVVDQTHRPETGRAGPAAIFELFSFGYSSVTTCTVLRRFNPRVSPVMSGLTRRSVTCV